MVYVALIILLGLLAASHFSNRDKLKSLGEKQYEERCFTHGLNSRTNSVRDAIYLIDKKIAKLEYPDNSDYHTKLFRALGGTIMRSDPDAEGFGHIEFRLSDRSTCNMYDKVDDAGIERQCKSMLDNLLPGVARGLDLMDHRLKLIEESKETKTKK